MNIHEDFEYGLPFPDVFPKSWNGQIVTRDFMAFRNLDHFKYVAQELGSQRDDSMCGMSYKEALNKLLAGVSDFPKKEQESIRNLVRENLHKRGLITEEVYENYKYSVDGTQVGVDVGKYTAGEPDCVITPTHQYIDFFYELYVSVSYAHYVTNEQVRANVAKLLATIEELERQHIFIKISLICPARSVSRDGNNWFGYIPMFSHKDSKTVDKMASVINDRLLRKFIFSIFENLYGDTLSWNYGYVIELDQCMNIGHEFNEVDFFEEVLEACGATNGALK